MDVFISYSRKDYQVADRLCREMDKVGISYFIDRKGITGGEHFIKTISQEILSCKVFVFIGSSAAYQSIWSDGSLQFGVDVMALVVHAVIESFSAGSAVEEVAVVYLAKWLLQQQICSTV